MPGFPVLHRTLKFAQVPVHCISDAIQPSHPLTPSSPLPSIFPSIRDISSKLAFASYDQNTGASASASASVLSASIQGCSSLRLTVSISLQSKGLWSLLQHHSSKASVLWCSAFFMVQLSQPYVTTGKTIALTI